MREDVRRAQHDVELARASRRADERVRRRETRVKELRGALYRAEDHAAGLAAAAADRHALLFDRRRREGAVLVLRDRVAERRRGVPRFGVDAHESSSCLRRSLRDEGARSAKLQQQDFGEQHGRQLYSSFRAPRRRRWRCSDVFVEPFEQRKRTTRRSVESLEISRTADAAHTMILTQCAACAKPLAYEAPRRVAASVR